MEAADTGETVGAVGSHHADPRGGWFEYGVTIGPDHRRKGYAAEAVVLLPRLMFAERRYHTSSSARIRRGGPPPRSRVSHRPVPRSGHDGMLAGEFDQLHSMSGW
ncbi:GNAT family N-acetyltransferase [Streptomyces sp. NBS 14/10]|nr:GNAT family N-acetyltransferase [Streptomyces sp. NBS 14/10]KAK1186485.1 GNAT family N-acetyltransferase [Streptomyces sp. NBS 14/10]